MSCRLDGRWLWKVCQAKAVPLCLLLGQPLLQQIERCLLPPLLQLMDDLKWTPKSFQTYWLSRCAGRCANRHALSSVQAPRTLEPHYALPAASTAILSGAASSPTLPHSLAPPLSSPALPIRLLAQAARRLGQDHLPAVPGVQPGGGGSSAAQRSGGRRGGTAGGGCRPPGSRCGARLGRALEGCPLCSAVHSTLRSAAKRHPLSNTQPQLCLSPPIRLTTPAHPYMPQKRWRRGAHTCSTAPPPSPKSRPAASRWPAWAARRRRVAHGRPPAAHAAAA